MNEEMQFIKMLYSISFWVILYIIVKIMTVKSGIGTNLLSQFLKYLAKFKDNVGILKASCLSKDVNVEKVSKALACVIKSEKKIAKIVDMYLYDDKSDVDVSQAKELINSIPNLCRDIVSKALDKGNENLDNLFNEIEKKITDAKSLIDNAIEIDKKKKMLQL